jgi:hypothetical protein
MGNVSIRGGALSKKGENMHLHGAIGVLFFWTTGIAWLGYSVA